MSSTNNTYTFSVTAIPDHGKVADYISGECYGQGDLTRNTGNYKVYKCKEAIASAPEPMNMEQWESTEVIHSVVIREQSLKEISMALSAMTTTTGHLDMASAGSILMDLCKVSVDPEIERVPKYKLSICLELASRYLETVNVIVKKN